MRWLKWTQNVADDDDDANGDVFQDETKNLS